MCLFMVVSLGMVMFSLATPNVVFVLVTISLTVTAVLSEVR